MVRVKFSTKVPPHWKTHSSDGRKRQQTKKGRQSKVENDSQDDESWLLLPEPAPDAIMQELDKPTRGKQESRILFPVLNTNPEVLVDIPTPLPGTRLHGAMELIPIGDIGKSSTQIFITHLCALLRFGPSITNIEVSTTVSQMYDLGCPPTNEEVVSNAKLFIQAAAQLDATGKIKDAAEAILVDLAYTIKGRDTGAFPVGQQYEYLEKQVTFLGTILEHIGHPPKTSKFSVDSCQTFPRQGHGVGTCLNGADHCYSLLTLFSASSYLYRRACHQEACYQACFPIAANHPKDRPSPSIESHTIKLVICGVMESGRWSPLKCQWGMLHQTLSK